MLWICLHTLSELDRTFNVLCINLFSVFLKHLYLVTHSHNSLKSRYILSKEKRIFHFLNYRITNKLRSDVVNGATRVAGMQCLMRRFTG